MDMRDDIQTVLVTEEQLRAKVAELGARISRDYAGKDLLLVSILKGAVVFMADLMRAVTIPCSIDFMVVSSYGGTKYPEHRPCQDRQGPGRRSVGPGSADRGGCAGHRRHFVQPGAHAQDAPPQFGAHLRHPG